MGFPKPLFHKKLTTKKIGFGNTDFEKQSQTVLALRGPGGLVNESIRVDHRIRRKTGGISPPFLLPFTALRDPRCRFVEVKRPVAAIFAIIYNTFGIFFRLTGWLAPWRAAWLPGWLPGLLPGSESVGGLAPWLAAWLQKRWLAGSLAGCLAPKTLAGWLPGSKINPIS